MAKAIDFLNADAPKRQSAKAFLGIEASPSGSAGGGALPDEMASLLGGEAGFYQPPMDAKTAESLSPSRVEPLDIKSLIAIKYAADDAQRIKVAASAMNRPDSDFTVKGGAVYLKDGGELVQVGGFGGKTPGDALSNFGKEAVATAASSPVSTAGNAALAFTAPGAIPSPWVQGVFGAGDELARRVVGNAFMPEWYGTGKHEWSLADTAAVPAAGVLSGVLTAGVNKALAPRWGNALSSLGKEEVAAAGEILGKSSVPLTLGQATGNPALLDAEARLRMLPGSLDIAKRHAEGQNTAAREAVERFTGGMASGDDVAGLGRNLVNAAGASLQEMKNARARAAGPLYELARMPGIVPLDASPILQGIEAKLSSQGTPEAVKSLLQKAKAQLFSNGALRDTPEGLQAAKQGIDALMEGLGENEAQAKAALMGVKSDLMDYMTRNVPGFKAANDVFAEMSAPIQAFGDSVLNKVRKLPPDKAANAPGMLFNPQASNPPSPSVVEGWEENIAGMFPQSWNDAVAARIIQAAKGARGSANGGPSNFSGQVAKELGGSQAAMDMWEAAMTPGQFQEFAGLVDILSRASQGSRGQSWTFAGGPAVEVLQDATMGPVEGAISRGLDVGRLASPGAWGDAFRDWRFRSNAPKLAEFLFNPPQDWQRMLPPNMITVQTLSLLPRLLAAQAAGGAFEKR